MTRRHGKSAHILSLLSSHVNWPSYSLLFLMLTLKIQGQGHGVVKRKGYVVGPLSNWFASFSFHIKSTIPANSKSDLEIFKVKVMGEVKGQGYIVDPVSNQCTSFLFHINWNNHSWDTAKRVFNFEKRHLKYFFSPWPVFPIYLFLEFAIDPYTLELAFVLQLVDADVEWLVVQPFGLPRFSKHQILQGAFKCTADGVARTFSITGIHQHTNGFIIVQDRMCI